MSWRFFDLLRHDMMLSFCPDLKPGRRFVPWHDHSILSFGTPYTSRQSKDIQTFLQCLDAPTTPVSFTPSTSHSTNDPPGCFEPQPPARLSVIRHLLNHPINLLVPLPLPFVPMIPHPPPPNWPLTLHNMSLLTPRKLDPHHIRIELIVVPSQCVVEIIHVAGRVEMRPGTRAGLAGAGL